MAQIPWPGRRFSKTISGVVLAAVVPAVPSGALLAQASPAPVVRVEGSSTVFPIMEVAARAFRASSGGRSVRVTMKETGTSAGLRRFCQGQIPIANASRPISTKELRACAARGVTFIELPLAFDAITVAVHPRNTWASSISPADLALLWNRRAQGRIRRWNQVNPVWPDKAIRLCGPGRDSGTYDYFNKAINGSEDDSRADYTASEDDTVLVRCVANDPLALGYFGFSYYRGNTNRLRALAIAGPKGTVAPSLKSVQQERYQPLSRPLFVYVNDRALREQASVRSFLTFTLQRGLRFSEQAGAIPLPADTYRLVESKLYRHVLGTSFGGDLPIGLSIGQAIRRSFEQIRSPQPR
ncbi:PstS family phosphate ABC transporter substrate-binding protein [Synechococcus sp. CCY 9618]|uniref:PstS family phosphate ABC transporter substrate-binding protein n=1 Tax=Synechococcus sp. CCY 9618 TaxID=2815602 RepID=UPI0020B2B147|nr:PstS family phosphate ABC transporter substrate-binding protein [Synechococcus sp. CCY 9618]